MPSKEELDGIDIAILSILQEHGCLEFHEIVKSLRNGNINLSRSSINYRLQKLVNLGYAERSELLYCISEKGLMKVRPLQQIFQDLIYAYAVSSHTTGLWLGTVCYVDAIISTNNVTMLKKYVEYLKKEYRWLGYVTDPREIEEKINEADKEVKEKGITIALCFETDENFIVDFRDYYLDVTFMLSKKGNNLIVVSALLDEHYNYFYEDVMTEHIDIKALAIYTINHTLYYMIHMDQVLKRDYKSRVLINGIYAIIREPSRRLITIYGKSLNKITPLNALISLANYDTLDHYEIPEDELQKLTTKEPS